MKLIGYISKTTFRYASGVRHSVIQMGTKTDEAQRPSSVFIYVIPCLSIYEGQQILPSDLDLTQSLTGTAPRENV